MDCQHTIHSKQSHLGWDNSIRPALTVAPGDTVEVECLEASGGQLTAESTVADIAGLDFAAINPVTGPIRVDGAEPGDAISVEFLDFKPVGWGWTANIPGFGLLADQFPDPELTIWKVGADPEDPSAHGRFGRIPMKPFCGTVGLALAEPGNHSVVPPRRVGGNLDIRDNCVGTTLYLPVEVAGGLLSIGDTHAAQGDGEVCGTAIESAMTVAVKVGLVKGAGYPFPRFETDRPVSGHFDPKGYIATTGIGPDLMRGVRDAVSCMIDWLCKDTGMTAVHAYMLCSVVGDLRVSQVVDAPNWTVSFYVPKLALR